MSNYAAANQVLPLTVLAGQPFGVGWALSVEDGSAYGTPFSVTGVTDVKIIAAQRVARGLTPPTATTWTQSNSGGITLSTIVVGGVTYPYVALAAPAAPGPGVYDAMLILVSASGDDLVLSFTLDVVEEP